MDDDDDEAALLNADASPVEIGEGLQDISEGVVASAEVSAQSSP